MPAGYTVEPTGGGRVTYSGGTAAQGATALAAAATGVAADGGGNGAGEEQQLLPTPVEQRRVEEHDQIGRNDPCWCGSGKKFKKCHVA